MLSDVRATSPGNSQLEEQLHYTCKLIEECFPGWGKGWKLLSGEQFEPSSSTSHAASLSAHLAQNQEPLPGSYSLGKAMQAGAPMWTGGTLRLWRHRGGLCFNKDDCNTCPQIRLALDAGTVPLYCFTAHSEGVTSIKRSDKCVIITSQLIRLEPNSLRAQSIFLPVSTRWR